jgi:hypothetical protein
MSSNGSLNKKTNGGMIYPGALTSNTDGLKATQNDRHLELFAYGSVILLLVVMVRIFVI